MLKHFAIVGLLLAMSVPAGAAPVDVSNPSRVTNTFQDTEIAAIAQSLGYKTDMVTADDGSQILVIVMQNGGVFVFPKACDTKPPRCLALEWQARYSFDNVGLSTVNAYNDQQGFAQAYVHEGTVFLSRTEIADYGIPVGNIGSSLKTFISLAGSFASFLQSRGQSALLTAPAAPSTAQGFGETLTLKQTVVREEPTLPKDAKTYFFAPPAPKALHLPTIR